MHKPHDQGTPAAADWCEPDCASVCVVVIARNEERHIGRCLESALRAASRVATSEVIVVDSASTDRTVAVASRYPVRLVRLGRSRLCAATGRYVGTRLGGGRYVAFVDGDTIISPEWIGAAVNYLETHPRVGGVAGREDQVYYRNGQVIGRKDDYFGNGDTEKTVMQLGGNAVFRRAALEAVGSFNPFVRSFEEAELGARLRQAGWLLKRIPDVMGFHHTVPPFAPSEYWRRLRSHLLTGQGQVLRLSIRQGLFIEHLRALNRVVMFTFWTFLGLLLACLAPFWSLFPVLGWAGLSSLLFAAFVLRSRSVVKPVVLIFDWAVSAPPLIWGFLLPPRDQRHFHLENVVVEDTGQSQLA